MHHGRSQLTCISSSQDQLADREGAAYGGYGGVYVHDYGGAMMQKEQSLLQQRRASRTSLQGLRPGGHEFGPPLEDAPPPPLMEYGPAPVLESPALALEGAPPEACLDMYPYRRTSLRQANSDKYSQVPRNLYTPLNNEDNGEKTSSFVGKKNSDIKIINNTATYQTLSEKNSNALANIAAGYNISGDGPGGYRASQMQHACRSASFRRASEPPRPIGRGSLHARNRSCDDLACSCCDAPAGPEFLPDPVSCASDAATDSDVDNRDAGSGGRGRWESGDDRENTRTISRAHLRRDSFGEVVSRRSPSQDSLEQIRTRSPTIMLDDPTPPPPPAHDSYGRRSPSQDSYSYTVSSRRSGSQDSLDQQVRRSRAWLCKGPFPSHSHSSLCVLYTAKAFQTPAVQLAVIKAEFLLFARGPFPLLICAAFTSYRRAMLLNNV